MRTAVERAGSQVVSLSSIYPRFYVGVNNDLSVRAAVAQRLTVNATVVGWFTTRGAK